MPLTEKQERLYRFAEDLKELCRRHDASISGRGEAAGYYFDELYADGSHAKIGGPQWQWNVSDVLVTTDP